MGEFNIFTKIKRKIEDRIFSQDKTMGLRHRIRKSDGVSASAFSADDIYLCNILYILKDRYYRGSFGSCPRTSTLGNDISNVQQ